MGQIMFPESNLSLGNADFQPAGVGLQLERFGRRDPESHPIVKVLLPGTSADRDGGILPGDCLLAVDGRSVIGQPLSRVSEAIRGRPGTSVQV